jgi:hypothetical protein
LLEIAHALHLRPVGAAGALQKRQAESDAVLKDCDTFLTVKNAGQAGGEDVRTVLVASLVAAILATIMIAALSTH